MTSNTQGRFRFDTLLAQKRHFDTPHLYRDSESISPSNPLHKSKKTARPTTPIAAVNECVRDSTKPAAPSHCNFSQTQKEIPSSRENPSVLNIC